MYQVLKYPQKHAIFSHGITTQIGVKLKFTSNCKACCRTEEASITDLASEGRRALTLKIIQY